MKRIFWITIFIFAFIESAFGAPPSIVIAPFEKRSNVFGGKEAVFRFFLEAPDSFRGMMGWRFAVSGGTVARGENRIAVDPGRSESITIGFQVPESKKELIMASVLSVLVYQDRSAPILARLDRNIWIFPEDPFAHRRTWLQNLALHLFDPGEKTAEVFTKAQIPFKRISNVDSFSEIERGILVIGEGISLLDYRGLLPMMWKRASAGIPVLCLALAEGEFLLPDGKAEGQPPVTGMSLKGREVIGRLDKRLDSEGWAPDGLLEASTVSLTGERGAVIGKIGQGQSGWPWMEIQFSAGEGKWILCGFRVIGKWYSSPTPRFLFLKLLEYMSEEREERLRE